MHYNLRENRTKASVRTSRVALVLILGLLTLSEPPHLQVLMHRLLDLGDLLRRLADETKIALTSGLVEAGKSSNSVSHLSLLNGHSTNPPIHFLQN